MNEIVEILLKQLKNGNSGIYIMIGTISGGILGSLVSVIGSIVTNWLTQKSELEKIKFEYEKQKEIEDSKRLGQKLEEIYKISLEVNNRVKKVLSELIKPYLNQESKSVLQDCKSHAYKTAIYNFSWNKIYNQITEISLLITLNFQDMEKEQKDFNDAILTGMNDINNIKNNPNERYIEADNIDDILQTLIKDENKIKSCFSVFVESIKKQSNKL